MSGGSRLLPPKNASFQGTLVLTTVPSRLRPPNTPLARVNEIRSAVTVDRAPAPTGPAATLASAPTLKEVDSSELNPLSVITTMTTSDTSMPAWKPTLAVARL